MLDYLFVFRKKLTWRLLSYGRFFLTLAKLHRSTLGRYSTVVMITGSFGKTTTTRAVRMVMGKSPGKWAELNTNYAGELWWTYLREALWSSCHIVEAGIYRPGNMAQYARILKPQIAVVTWIGGEHLLRFGTLDAIYAEKACLVRQLTPRDTAVLNWDDPRVRHMAEETPARVISFGRDPTCAIFAEQVTLDWPHGTTATVHAYGQQHRLRTQLIGSHAMASILAAIAVGILHGKNLSWMCERLEALPPTRGRLQPVMLPNGISLLSDEYKATPQTAHLALDILAQVPAKRRVVVIGELNNLYGDNIAQHYQEVGQHIGKVADTVIVVGNCAKMYAVGLEMVGFSLSHMQQTRHVHEAIQVLKNVLQPGDTVLLKGWEDLGLRRIMLALRGHTITCQLAFCPFHQQFCEECRFL